MSEANANRRFLPVTRDRVLAGVVIAGFLGGAVGLWWRFGEAVFLTSVMNGIIACF
jgi:hypothetical protein